MVCTVATWGWGAEANEGGNPLPRPSSTPFYIWIPAVVTQMHHTQNSIKRCT